MRRGAVTSKVPRDAEARAFWFTYGYRGKPADTFDITDVKGGGDTTQREAPATAVLRFGAGMLSFGHDM